MLFCEAPMYQRIMEILVFLMDEFNGRTWQPEQMDQVSEDLIQRGYTEQEINTAFHWLYYRLGWDNDSITYSLDINTPTETSHRLLHRQEKRHFTMEAFGYLLQLKHLKLITAKELEEVIERVISMDIQSASVEIVKKVVQSILFEEESSSASGIKPLQPPQKGETYH